MTFVCYFPQAFYTSVAEYERVPGVQTVTSARHPDPSANETAGMVLTTDLDTFLSNHQVAEFDIDWHTQAREASGTKTYLHVLFRC